MVDEPVSAAERVLIAYAGPTESPRIEEAAVILAFFNRSPRVADNVTPRGYWKTWTPEAKEHYRNKVRAVLAAIEECDADAGLPFVKVTR
jgi:hypothetical protein